MAVFLYKTQNGDDPKGKPRVYFTCHPEDFENHFEKIKNDIFKTHDCAIYYTEDMSEPIAQEDLETDLGQMNLIVVPVTARLLTEPNRAMDLDIAYAKQAGIPILPFMMERGLDKLYAQPEHFGKRQYLDPFSTDYTAIGYEEKLKLYLLSDEMAKRVRAAFNSYIFLSYRKKDRRYANELMKQIHSNPECRDIAIWFDEFLTPGENFVDNIQKALAGSNLFALLVTPNLLEEPEGKPNYVMAEEYPAAREAKKVIFPAEMEETDHDMLAAKFEDIPACIDTRDEEIFKENLLQALKEVTVSSNNDDPEHYLLIGLAYLEGIDVEVNRHRGMALLTLAAEAELPEAMDWLYGIYADVNAPEANEEKALQWAKRRADYYTRQYGENNPITAMAMGDLAEAYLRMNDCIAGSYFETDWDEYYLSDAFLSEALSVANRAYTLCRKMLGEESIYALNALCTLARVCEELNKFEEAIALLEEGLAFRSKIMGQSHEGTGLIQELLIDLCLKAGQYERRLELCKITYEDTCKRIGPENAELLLDRLATAYGDVGNLKLERELLEKLCTTEFARNQVFLHIQEHLFSTHGGERRRTLLETEYELKRKFLGEYHEDTLETLERIALYTPRDMHHKAVELLERVYALRCEHLGEECWSTRYTLIRITDTYDSAGDARKAAEYLEKYILQCEKLDEEEFILDEIERLAELYNDLGYYKKAMALSVKYYVLQSKFHKKDLLKEQKTAQILVEAHCGTGDYAKALSLQEKVCDRLREQFGDDDENTLVAYSNLAKIYCGLNEYATAMELHKDIPMRLREKLYPEHPEMLNALKIMALIYGGMGNHTAALELQQTVHTSQCETLGNKHRSTLNTASDLANTYAALGEYEPAKRLEEFAGSVWCETLGEEHPKARSSMNHLAYIHYKLGNVEKALEIKGRVMAARSKAAGAEKTDFLTALGSLVYDYKKSDHPANEIAFDEYAFKLSRDTMGEDHMATKIAQSNLAYTYFVYGWYQKSYEYFHDVYRWYHKTLGEKSFAVTNAIRQLADLCTENGCLDNQKELPKETHAYAELLRWML